MLLTRLLRISGRVQGVGFRQAMVGEARRLGLAGWVRNRSDGTVEAVVVGDEPQIDALVHWAHRGPEGARVDGVAVQEMTTGATHPDTFELRQTL